MHGPARIFRANLTPFSPQGTCGMTAGKVLVFSVLWYQYAGLSDAFSFPLLHQILSYYAEGCMASCMRDRIIRYFPLAERNSLFQVKWRRCSTPGASGAWGRARDDGRPSRFCDHSGHHNTANTDNLILNLVLGCNVQYNVVLHN